MRYIVAEISPACVPGWLNIQATIERHVARILANAHACCGLFLSRTGAESVQSLLGYKRSTSSRVAKLGYM